MSEGKVHSKAKREIYKRLKRDNDLTHASLEEPVGAQEDQIADIYAENTSGEKYAVEIQCSHQSEEEFQRRSTAYRDKDIAVLWIINEDEFTPEKESRDGTEKGYHFNKAVRWLQRHYYGRAYVLNPDTFVVFPARYSRIKTVRHNDYEPYAGDYSYTYKQLASRTTDSIPDYELVTAESNGITIARFRDKCWWK